MKFLGYKRPDGKVGVRNKIFILPTSVCASDTTRIIASQIEGAVTFNNQNGCSQVSGDQQLTMDVMAGMAANPNVYGIIIISLGCENCQMDLVVNAIKERTNKPMETFIIQENGGTITTIEKAVRAGRKMAQEASKLQREEVDISELIIGTECGGSDPTSGLASNVLIGELSDRLVELGSTSILSETTEFIGAEHILASRAKNQRVKERTAYRICISVFSTYPPDEIVFERRKRKDNLRIIIPSCINLSVSANCTCLVISRVCSLRFLIPNPLNKHGNSTLSSSGHSWRYPH